jgi:hypothetical protein
LALRHSRRGRGFTSLLAIAANSKLRDSCRQDEHEHQTDEEPDD